MRAFGPAWTESFKLSLAWMFGKAESATTLREVEEEPDYLWSCGTILGMFLFIVFMNEIDFSEKFYWGKKITTKLSKSYWFKRGLES